MLSELEYPFDAELILQKKKSLRRRLLEDKSSRVTKKIAILGGSTTNDIKKVLELFLLNKGIAPVFYESEYAQYWQDVMFDNPELFSFAPDLIYIHTSTRNIHEFPTVRCSEDDIESMLLSAYRPYEQMWDKIAASFHCPVIQNNFEQPFYRLLGNKDVSDSHGKLNFVSRLNDLFYRYAQTHDNFFIQDINYLASCYGLTKWADPYYWHMYKYALAVPAIPELAYNLSNIIGSVYGRNKKALVLDLDNTLWGGIVGDDGPENIEIGQETPTAQLYSEFQRYVKEQTDLGVLLSIDSKNDEENAIAGLNRPDSVLHPDDFLVIKANWEPKDRNLVEIASQINIGTDSLVFVDDNPAERHIVKSQVPEAAVPEMTVPEHYITDLDRAGYFEVTALSRDDLSRNEMYKANLKRQNQEASFTDYHDYLLSLKMKAEILPFSPMYMARIAQLTNKSNQFNLTTLRCSQADIEQYASDSSYITLYGKLEDCFGDNGVVSVVFGHVDAADSARFHIDLWLMSCRVLKRNMEFAMMDSLAVACKKRGIRTIRGYYYPTAKNKMVKDFYSLQGFSRISEDPDGNSVWEFSLEEGYTQKNDVIQVNPD